MFDAISASFSAWENIMVQNHTNPPRRSRTWLIGLPLFAVLLLAAAWSAYWYGATTFAAAAMDKLIAREAARGRVITCDERVQGGFPFRFEVTCQRPAISWQTPQGPASLNFKRLSGVALAYNLGHVIFEITGPLESRLPPSGTRPTHVRANWDSLQASLILDILGEPSPRNFALVVDQLQVWAGSNEAVYSGPPTLKSSHAETHALRRKQDTGKGPDFDISLQADQVVVREPDGGISPLTELMRAEFLGTAFSVPIFESNDFRTLVALWQKRDGHLEIARLWADDGHSALLGKGDLSLSPMGAVNGNASIAVTGIDAILARFGAADNEENNALKIALGALGMIGRSVEMGDRQGIEVPLLFKDGAVSLGGMLDIKLPPLLPPNLS